MDLIVMKNEGELTLEVVTKQMYIQCFLAIFQALHSPGHTVFDDFVRHIEDILATRGLTYFIVIFKKIRV